MTRSLLMAVVCLFACTGMAQLKNLDSLKIMLNKTEQPAKKILLLENILDIYLYTGKADDARNATRQMLEIARDSHDDKFLGEAYLYTGSFFSTNCDYKQSLEFLFKGLLLAEKSHSTINIFFSNKEIGVTYKDLKNYPEALKYLKRAEVLVESVLKENILLKTRTYMNLAEVYLALGQQNEALKKVQSANEITSKNDGYGYARILYIFAKIYSAKGDDDLAEIYYKKCIAFSEKENIVLPFVNAATDYAQYLLDTKQLVASKQFGLKSYAMAIQSNNKLGVIDAAALLQKTYRTLQLKDSSYYFADIKEAYRDSIFSEQQTNQIQNMSFAQQIKEKEDDEKREAEARDRQQNIQYAFIATGIITFFIFFLMLSRTVIVNEKWISFLAILALLLVFEFINLLIHPFLERITHHSPVLMLLCLVVLASLLIPLHHKLEHFIKHRLTEKNKAIRLAAAKKTIEQLENE